MVDNAFVVAAAAVVAVEVVKVNVVALLMVEIVPNALNKLNLDLTLPLMLAVVESFVEDVNEVVHVEQVVEAFVAERLAVELENYKFRFGVARLVAVESVVAVFVAVVGASVLLMIDLEPNGFDFAFLYLIFEILHFVKILELYVMELILLLELKKYFVALVELPSLAVVVHYYYYYVNLVE
jgi:hypothetical protein